jgi:uncharacterized protein (DUF2141 family)
MNGIRIGFAAAAFLGWAPAALAADVSVRVSGIADGVGTLRVAACTEAEFLKTCRLTGSVPARSGSIDVRIGAVPTGRYAIQAFHDRDNDGKLATGILGLPAEPFGFSRAPSMRFGPPAFADAAVDIDGRQTIVPVALSARP